jgi:tRNA (cytidine/uridine-2'-O-)-methyltransferase
MQIALFEPEIPPNTGNIGRLCVNGGVPLQIIGKPAFDLSEKAVRRAGLDYWDQLRLTLHPDWDSFLAKNSGSRIFLVTKFGPVSYTSVRYLESDILVFGRETRGLPPEILSSWPETQKIFIPMQPESRSINLSNAVAIVLFEGLRQIRQW